MNNITKEDISEYLRQINYIKNLSEYKKQKLGLNNDDQLIISIKNKF